MPRPKKAGTAEPKTRSRNGCWPCKNRKIKCGEERPNCLNCERQGEQCDYSIRLNWEGRAKRKGVVENEESTLTQPKPTARLDILSNQRIPKIEETTPRVSNSSLNWESTIDPSLDRTRNGGMEHTHLRLDAVQTNTSYSSPRVLQGPMHRDHISASQLSRIREQSTNPYPSPAESSVESPPSNPPLNTSYGGYQLPSSNLDMPPPLHGSPHIPSYANNRGFHGDMGFANPGVKRRRLSPPLEVPDSYHRDIPFQPGQFSTGWGMNAQRSPQFSQYQASSDSNSSLRNPPTPAASSVGSEDYHHSAAGPSPQPSNEAHDFRRLSVKSLLSDDSPADSVSSEGAFPGSLNINSFVSTQKTTYGIDRGFPDLDLPHNSDSTALNGVTPALSSAELANTGINGDDFYSEFGFGLNAANAYQDQVAYYAKPVTVSISKSLEPLPDTLRKNPMNLLYFHHFLNHTARILVPHDCSENPFKSVLPQMAVRNTNLLNLLLAYSASHRSRLLNHREPSTRIALWVENVFPDLRLALNSPNNQISDSNLATAIMLASLEIVSPNTFEFPIPWQNHLKMARQIMLARGRASSVDRRDKVSYFLTRWFAYLDVLGSLSGGANDQPLFSGQYWAHDPSSPDDEQDFQIDCLLGFTSRCVSILAKIAELARECDGQRIDPRTGDINPAWRPSPQTIAAAEQLKNDLQEARMHRYRGCPHRRPSTQVEDTSYAIELATTNDCFHWAGLIHLNRRILNIPSSDPEVQSSVREILASLYKVKPGGTAEGCLLFPIFTAGCEARGEGERALVRERLRGCEGNGMCQVRKARGLMERCWESGRAWETLVAGEFFG